MTVGGAIRTSSIAGNPPNSLLLHSMTAGGAFRCRLHHELLEQMAICLICYHASVEQLHDAKRCHAVLPKALARQDYIVGQKGSR